MTDNKNREKNQGGILSALSVAKYLLSLDEEREYFNNKRIRNKITSTTTTAGKFRLSQMLYLLQILYYLKYKQLLFEDKLYAWENGMIVYSVYTHFWSLYNNMNGKEIASIKDQKTKGFITKCFEYLRTTSNGILQEFAYTDPIWSTTWTKSPQPEVDFTAKENQEIYQQFCSPWLHEAGL